MSFSRMHDHKSFLSMSGLLLSKRQSLRIYQRSLITSSLLIFAHPFLLWFYCLNLLWNVSWRILLFSNGFKADCKWFGLLLARLTPIVPYKVLRMIVRAGELVLLLFLRIQWSNFVLRLHIVSLFVVVLLHLLIYIHVNVRPWRLKFSSFPWIFRNNRRLVIYCLLKLTLRTRPLGEFYYPALKVTTIFFFQCNTNSFLDSDDYNSSRFPCSNVERRGSPVIVLPENLYGLFSVFANTYTIRCFF